MRYNYSATKAAAILVTVGSSCERSVAFSRPILLYHGVHPATSSPAVGLALSASRSVLPHCVAVHQSVAQHTAIIAALFALAGGRILCAVSHSFCAMIDILQVICDVGVLTTAVLYVTVYSTPYGGFNLVMFSTRGENPHPRKLPLSNVFMC